MLSENLHDSNIYLQLLRNPLRITPFLTKIYLNLNLVNLFPGGKKSVQNQIAGSQFSLAASRLCLVASPWLQLQRELGCREWLHTVVLIAWGLNGHIRSDHTLKGIRPRALACVLWLLYGGCFMD